MPSSGGIVLSIALGSVGSILQHLEQENTCGAVASTAWVTYHSVLHRFLLHQCRSGAALSDAVRLEHIVLLGVMGCCSAWQSKDAQVTAPQLGWLGGRKEVPRINPPFLLPLFSSEIGGFEVRGG